MISFLDTRFCIQVVGLLNILLHYVDINLVQFVIRSVSETIINTYWITNLTSFDSLRTRTVNMCTLSILSYSELEAFA